MEIENKGLSILICNYNGSLEDIIFTLNSSIRQKGIPFEVLFCDDGSKENHEKEVLEFFKRNNFKDYVMLCHKENKGTVQNIYDGLKHSKHPYIKTIGTGDAFYAPETCKEVVDFMIENNLDYCFGDGVYFFDDKKEIKTFNLNQPAILDVYNKETLNKDRIIKNLMIYNDFILGAALFAKKDILLSYFDKMNQLIIYEEDAIITTSIVDGANIMRYPNYCVYYEYGSGISTNPNPKFIALLYKDKLELFKYISENCDSKYSKKALKLAKVEGSSKKDKMKRTLICPSKLTFKMKCKKANNVVKPEYNFDFYRLCKEGH